MMDRLATTAGRLVAVFAVLYFGAHIAIAERDPGMASLAIVATLAVATIVWYSTARR